MKNIEELVGIIIAASIAVILVAALVMPVISEAANERTTATNESPICYMDVNKGSDIVIEYANSTMTVNDLNVTDLIGSRLLLAIADNMALFAYSNGTGIYATVEGEANFYNTTSATISNGSLSFIAGGVSKTFPVTGDILYLSSKTTGQYGEYLTFTTQRINDDSIIRGYGNATLANAGLSPTSVGTIYGFVGTYDNLSGYGTGLTSLDVSLTAPPTETDDSLALVNTVMTLSGTTAAGTYTANNAGSIWAIPIHYTYESSMDSALNSIMGIIPILMVIGILLGVAGVIFYTRK